MRIRFTNINHFFDLFFCRIIFLHVCWSNWPNFHSFHFSFNIKPLRWQGEGGGWWVVAVWMAMHGKMRRLLKAVQWHFPRIAAWQQRPPDVHVYFSEPLKITKYKRNLRHEIPERLKKQNIRLAFSDFSHAMLSWTDALEWSQHGQHGFGHRQEHQEQKGP